MLLSAGFDAAKGDVGNCKHSRRGSAQGLDLTAEDYLWSTERVRVENARKKKLFFGWILKKKIANYPEKTNIISSPLCTSGVFKTIMYIWFLRPGGGQGREAVFLAVFSRSYQQYFPTLFENFLGKESKFEWKPHPFGLN